MAKLLLNLEKGDHIKLDEVYYNKIKAIILEPKENKGNIMLDGEYVNVDTSIIFLLYYINIYNY
jgi:diacylglycerol kinase family enzyme